VELAQIYLPDKGHQVLKTLDVTPKAGFVLMLHDEFGSRLFKSSIGANTKDARLALAFNYPREDRFCLFKPTCSSAAENTPSSDLLFDMPDPRPLSKSWRLFASHVFFPFRAGRPLRAI
jgi:hypothetical protein